MWSRNGLSYIYISKANRYLFNSTHIRINGNVDKTMTCFSEKSFVGEMSGFHSSKRTLWDIHVNKARWRSVSWAWESGLLYLLVQRTVSSYLTDAVRIMDIVDLYADYNFKEDNGTESGFNTIITMLWQFSNR